MEGAMSSSSSSSIEADCRQSHDSAALGRWDGEGRSSSSKIIALDEEGPIILER